MNRNAAILALASCAVLAFGIGLAWSWRGTTGTAETPSAADPTRIDDSREGSALVLDRAPPEAESERRATEAAPAPAESVEDSDDEEASPELQPVLVAGQVVDQARSPVPGARVIVLERVRPGFPAPRIVAEGVSDRQGRFEIRGTAEDLDLEARASKERYYDSVLRPFRRGATDVQIAVREGGLVAGRLLLDPWVPMEKIRVIVQPIAERATGDVRPSRNSERTPSTVRLGPRGTFAQFGVTEPTVRLSVRVENDPWDAVRIEDVPVRDVAELQDSRLDPIDLRGRFELVGVVVLDDAGAELDGARVALRSSEDPAVGCSRVAVGGRAEFLTRTGPHDFEVDLEGCRRARLAGVYGDQVVRMKRGIPVRITLQGKAPNPTPPARIAIALLKSGRKEPLTLGGMSTFEDPRQTTLLVTAPGPYEVAWYLESGGNRRYLTGSPGRTVEIRDLEEGQDLVLEFPSEVLAAIQ
jgi:hypothetical protein